MESARRCASNTKNAVDAYPIARPREAAASRFGAPLKVGLSVQQRLIDEPFEHLAVIRANRARGPAHVDTDALFLRIAPKIRPGVTGPHEFARQPRHAGTPP